LFKYQMVWTSGGLSEGACSAACHTLELLQGIVQRIAKENMTHTVTGFGILNEPFKDCPPHVMQDYNQRAIRIVRETLGANTSIYIADNFNATLWNKPSSSSTTATAATTSTPNEAYWNDNDPQSMDLYQNTFLDSHYYHGT